LYVKKKQRRRGRKREENGKREKRGEETKEGWREILLLILRIKSYIDSYGVSIRGSRAHVAPTQVTKSSRRHPNKI
jgi:hypothetical protein